MRFGSISTACFEVPLRVVPAGFVEDFSAEQVLRDHAREAVQSHDLGVPLAHDVQRAGVLGIRTWRSERFVAHDRRVLHPVT